jgi:regulator of cell morphogenesis and NO signaling
MTNFAEQTLATIVTQNHQTVAVLEKYHLDFCCKGKRTLAEACNEKGLSIENVLKELDNIGTIEDKKFMPFSAMTAEQLISYILIHHHFYVKQNMPTILLHIKKVVEKHGDSFPYMRKVLQLFIAIKEEMELHMQKEEMVLFPRIKEIETLVVNKQQIKLASSYINGPINMMEMEHEHAGNTLYDIRQLTKNYTPPQQACTTFKVCMIELKEFEENLHRHVHLENNLLFPLAQKLLKTSFSVTTINETLKAF